MGLSPEVCRVGFNSETGRAETYQACAQSCRAIAGAIHLLQRKLHEVPFGPWHNPIQAELIGIAGSFVRGRPRIGLYPQHMSYDDASREQLVVSRQYPSDIDVEIKFRNGRDEEIEPRCYEVHILGILRQIFDQTRVFLDWKPNMARGAVSLDEFWRKL